MRAIWLAINVTFDCNKKCNFCYNNGVKMSSFTMGSDEVNCLVSTFEKHIQKYGDSYHNLIGILGGEPLLYLDMVKELITKFRSVSLNTFIDVFTNGLLLDEDFILWTKRNKASVILSANDTPLGILRDKALLIHKHRKYSRISVVLTKYNLQRLNHLVSIADEASLHLRLRHEYSGGIDPDYINMYDRIIPQVIQRIVDEEIEFYPHLFFEMMTGMIPYEVKHLCGRRFFGIDPNLDIRPCLAQDDRIGNLTDPDFDFFEIINKSNCIKSGYEGIPECEACEFRTICFGGCPLTKKLAFGRIDVPSPFCKTFKKVIPLIIKMKDNWIATGRGLRY